MYRDDIKLLAKNKKELETLTLSRRIYSLDKGMEFSIEKRYQANNEKWKKINNERNRTARSRKNQNRCWK